MEASECAFDTITEAFELVAQDEARKVSIVQEIMIRSTDYLRRIITPVGGHGGVTMSYLCSNCNSFPFGRLHLGEKGRNNWWCAICEEKYDWKQPNWLLVVQTGESIGSGRAWCANLINALMLTGEAARRWRRSHTEHRDKPC